MCKKRRNQDWPKGRMDFVAVVPEASVNPAGDSVAEITLSSCPR